VGDFSKPNNSEKVEVSVDELAKLGGTTSSVPKGASYGFYISTDKPADIKSFFEKSMKDKGYEELPTSSDNSAAGLSQISLNFKKGDTGAALFAIGPLDATTIPAFESTFPPIKGKIKAGSTLVILASAKVADMGPGFK
jgi:hypothetical protein